MFSTNRPNIAPITDDVWQGAARAASNGDHWEEYFANRRVMDFVEMRIRHQDIGDIVAKAKAIGNGVVLYALPGHTYKVKVKDGKIQGVR